MGDTFACNCIGPQNGQPRCPCMMRNVTKRDGHWIERERDLGPVTPSITLRPTPHGCICPPKAEETCKGPTCPRRAIGCAQ